MKIITSEKVIEYLKENLNLEECISIFLVGSTPEKLIPGSDLDIVIVIKSKTKNKFLDHLKSIMDKLVDKNKNITYSFVHGPVKFEDKGLIEKKSPQLCCGWVKPIY